MTETTPSFERSRKLRLDDAIADYLNDDDVDARRAYEEMLCVIDDWMQYHEKHLEKARQLKMLMCGYREIDNIDNLAECIDNISSDLGRHEFLKAKKDCEIKYTDTPERY
jgi:hypothetical protein